MILIKTMKQFLPKIFGFEKFGFLMHIEKQNEYYDIQPSELSDGQLVQRNSFCYPNNVGFSAKCRTAKNGLIYYDA